MFRWFSLLALGAFTLVGCTQGSAVTDVAADGSYKRSIAISHSSGSLGEVESNPRAELEQMFRLPSGAGWKTEWGGTDQEVKFTAERAYAAGESGGADLVTLEGGKEESTNEFSVKEVEPGVFEYREKIAWKGERAKLSEFNPEALESIKKKMGESATKVTDADLQTLGRNAQVAATRLMMGPTEPMIFSLLSSPEYGVRKLTRELGKALLKETETFFGERLTAAEQRTLVRGMIETMDLQDAANEQVPNPTEADPSGGPTSLVTFSLTVKMPGEVISTNGELDPLTGEVFWSFLPESASFGDFELVARSTVAK